MGQAALDLPDPLQKPSLDHVPSADDLLAQMATAEIDRLLAETEEGPPLAPESHTTDPIAQARAVAAEEVAQLANPAPLPAAGPSPAPPKNDVDPATDSQIDALFEQLDAAPAVPALEIPPEQPAPAPQAAPAIDLPSTDQVALSAPAAPAPEIPSTPAVPLQSESDIARELERLFRGLSPTLEEASASPSPTPAPDPNPPAGPPAQTADSTLAPDASTPAEKQALDLAQDTLEDLPAAPATSEQSRPSLLLRLLEILSAPMDIFGDGVREALGKIAIATLINALALLIYVVLFRH